MEVDDAELLALAGGDDSSDEEETTQAPPAAAKAISPLPTINLSPPQTKDRSGMTPKVSARRGTSKALKKRKAESEDEGEA